MSHFPALPFSLVAADVPEGTSQASGLSAVYDNQLEWHIGSWFANPLIAVLVCLRDSENLSDPVNVFGEYCRINYILPEDAKAHIRVMSCVFSLCWWDFPFPDSCVLLKGRKRHVCSKTV